MKTVLCLLTLVVLAGCSAAPPPEEKVATLETTGATPAPTSAAPAASRPRERLDMTNEELIALSEAHNQCLMDNGGGRKPESGSGGPVAAPVDEATIAAAEAACLDKKPLPPWEYDVANPESADFVHDVVQCLRDKGVEYVEEWPVEPGEDRRSVAFGGEQNDPESISKGMNLIGGCEKELSAG
jgi:hypothetical protein